MKNVLALIAKFVVLLLLEALGSLAFHPFHIETQLQSTTVAQRSFVWDGVILMLAGYLLLLVIAAIRRRFVLSAPWTTLALALAALSGYLLKFGFITHNW